MKTLQQIEKEYETYCGKTDVVKSLDDFLSFIEIGIDDTEEYQKDYEKELKENNRWKLYEKIQNFFFFIFNDDIDDIYDSDSEILRKCICFTKIIGSFYRRIRSIAIEDNYKELVKLVDFSSDYYFAQTDYYDYAREQLDLYIKGIDLYHARYEDNCEPFCEFMEKKIQSMESTSSDVKTPIYMKGRL